MVSKEHPYQMYMEGFLFFGQNCKMSCNKESCYVPSSRKILCRTKIRKSRAVSRGHNITEGISGNVPEDFHLLLLALGGQKEIILDLNTMTSDQISKTASLDDKNALKCV